MRNDTKVHCWNQTADFVVMCLLAVVNGVKDTFHGFCFNQLRQITLSVSFGLFFFLKL